MTQMLAPCLLKLTVVLDQRCLNFEGEALGLNAMYATGSILVPKPFKVGPLPTGGSYIIMEYVEFGASSGNQSTLGRKLAEMHKAGKSEKGFRFYVDNTTC